MVFDLTTILTGVLIFLARVVDVSLGTMRTISIVNGRTKTAFFLGFIEVGIWLSVISTVINKVTSQPLLGVFYAFGFATGNAAGIMLEKRLAMGHMVLRVITAVHGKEMSSQLRELGFSVTTFQGEGMLGPVTELYIVCNRKDCRQIINVIQDIEPEVFFVTEPAGVLRKKREPTMQPATGWRAVLKKK